MPEAPLRDRELVLRRLEFPTRVRADCRLTRSPLTRHRRGKAPRPTRPLARPQASSLLVAAVAGLTMLGATIRLANFDQSFIGDELSTYWILHGHGLGDVLSAIRSNDEITPPLYFIFA